MTQQKAVIIGSTIFLVLFGVLVWFSRPEARRQPASIVSSGGGELAATETSFDFGEISMAKGRVRHTYVLKNTSENQVAVEKVYTSCMCTEAKFTKTGGKARGPYGMPGHGFIPRINETLLPGAEAEVEVIFDPAAHGPSGVGPIERVVYIESANAPTLELKFSAMVRP
ncbi:DUF1573 domain-containing protein [Candidatus Parcubacteria bacterium]|nr:DUF1573 domain-containing protein [Candidatus Parcubacteria bacterium]